MRILRIIYDWPPPWHGLAPAPYEMSTSQVKLGNTIDVLCGRWPFAGPIEKINGVKIRSFFREPLPGTVSITTSIMLFFYYLVWRGRSKIDVIHSHGHFAIWIYALRVFLKRRYPDSKELKTPLVVHFHNTVKGRWAKLEEEGKTIKPMSKYFSWPLAQKSDQWAVEAADACIFVSGEIRQDAIKYYDADPAKCFVVETGVNIELFSPVGFEEIQKTREELGLKDKDKIILNSGAMVERKNIHILIEALNYLPLDYKLLLIGPPASVEYEGVLQDTIVKYDLSPRIVRIGYTPYPQVHIVHQIADLFVLPSEWEGMPKVVMQSLACGVPALASGFEAQNDIGGLLYIDNLEVKSVAKKIKETIEADVAVDLGFVRSHYSWDVMAKKVEEVYSNLLNH